VLSFIKPARSTDSLTWSNLCWQKISKSRWIKIPYVANSVALITEFLTIFGASPYLNKIK
jgi:hypothetical protein